MKRVPWREMILPKKFENFSQDKPIQGTFIRQYVADGDHGWKVSGSPQRGPRASFSGNNLEMSHGCLRHGKQRYQEQQFL